MKTPRKILSFLVLTILLFSSSLQTFALSEGKTSSLMTRISYSKSSVERNVKKADKYIKAIDQLIEAKKDDKAYLEKLKKRLTAKYPSLYASSNSNAMQVVYIINYVVAKANLEIAKLEDAESISLLKEIEEGGNISESDAKKVEQKILSLQKHIISTSDDIFGVFQKFTSYEEKGTSEISLKVNEESFGSLASHLKISDYVGKSNLFDSQVTGDIEGALEYSIAGEDLKLEFSSFVDFISKDGNMYLLLEKFESMVESDDPKFENIMNLGKKISDQLKHIKFDDERSKRQIQAFKSILDKSSDMNKYKALLDSPILKAYKKEGNTYYLVPTKEFCSHAKRVFGGMLLGIVGESGCSESQYTEMLVSYLKDGPIYLTINGSTSTLGFEEKDGKVETKLSFNSRDITMFSFKTLSDSPYSPVDRTEVLYNKGKSFKISAEGKDFSGKFDSKLSSNNTFTSFDMNIDAGDDFMVDMKLSNQKLNGSVVAKSRGIEMFSADINGKIKRNYMDMDIDFEIMDFIRRSDDKILGEFNMNFSKKGYKTKADLGLYIKKDKINIVEFEIIGEAEVKYGEVEILTPEDFTTADEIFSEEDYENIY